MRRYEAVIVFDPTLSEEVIKKECGKVESLLQTAKASNVKVSIWGRREIAYLVHKTRYGIFVAVEFETEDPQAILTIRNYLRLQDSVNKFQIHRQHDRVRKFKGRPHAKDDSGEWDRSDMYDDGGSNY